MQKKITTIFKEKFPLTDNVLVIRSPGRINIIGEHTDYNNGFVLPAAIDKAAYIAVSLRDDNMINLVAADMNETFSTNVSDLKPVGDISWPNYLLGVVAQFINAGVPFKGMNAVLMSDVPVGAGLSSSAAIECAMVFALNELLQTNFDKMQMVKMAQKAEHEFAGVMCGIMDQFASMMGKKDHVIKLDCESLQYEYVPFKLDGYKILLLNTNVKHSLASSEYNTRRKECEAGVTLVKNAHPSVHSLRDCTIDMLNKYVKHENKLVYKRCRYVVDEINRLQSACEDLRKDNLQSMGKKMFETHAGLSKLYEVSCPELDLLTDFAQYDKNIIGARMMGGGFGGCTINIIKEEAVGKFINHVKPHYENITDLPLTYYISSIENGTEIIA